jgi:hypothetical protein
VLQGPAHYPPGKGPSITASHSLNLSLNWLSHSIRHDPAVGHKIVVNIQYTSGTTGSSSALAPFWGLNLYGHLATRIPRRFLPAYKQPADAVIEPQFGENRLRLAYLLNAALQ